MYCEADFAGGNIVSGTGGQTVKGKMVRFNDTVDDVTQKVVSVHTKYVDCYRIEPLRICNEIVHDHNGVAFLGCGPDGLGTVPAVNLYVSVSILESDDFAPRHGVAI